MRKAALFTSDSNFRSFGRLRDARQILLPLNDHLYFPFRLLIADDFPDSQFLPESLEDDDGINLLCRDLDSGIIARAEHHDNLLGKP